MKILKTLILAIFLCLAGQVFSQKLTAEVAQKEGVYLIYPGQKPVFEYVHVGTIDAGSVIKNWRASTLVDKLLKVYKKEEFHGDALIFIEADMWKADVVKFKSTKPEKVLVEIEQKEGVYLLFPGQRPTFEYEYSKTIDAGLIIKNWRASTLVEKLLKVYKKENLRADALFFIEDDLWKADAIKLK